MPQNAYRPWSSLNSCARAAVAVVAVLDVVEADRVGPPDLDPGARDGLAVGAGDHALHPARLPYRPVRHVAADRDLRRALDEERPEHGRLGRVPVGLVVDRRSVCIETPSTSDNRMNSCRRSSVMWPHRVRNRMAVSHSSVVSRVSRTNACRCRVRACISCFNRGDGVSSNDATTSRTSASSRAACSVEISLTAVFGSPGRDLRNDGLGIVVSINGSSVIGPTAPRRTAPVRSRPAPARCEPLRCAGRLQRGRGFVVGQ